MHKVLGNYALESDFGIYSNLIFSLHNISGNFKIIVNLKRYTIGCSAQLKEIPPSATSGIQVLLLAVDHLNPAKLNFADAYESKVAQGYVPFVRKRFHMTMKHSVKSVLR